MKSSFYQVNIVSVVEMSECSSDSMLLCLCEGVGCSMSQMEEKEGNTPSKTALSGKHDSETKAQR